LKKSFLHQKFIVENLTCEDIAKQLGYHKTTIKKYLRKFGIRKSDQEDYAYRCNNIPYGKRLIHRKAVEHKGELKLISTIAKLYSEGLHPNAIARVLDSMNLPTKKRAKGWHHHMIIAILKREGIYKLNRKPRGKK